MLKIALVRGAYLNNFECQNYVFGKKMYLHAFSSLNPLHTNFAFPVTRLPSLTDIPLFDRAIKFVANRTLGDAQILFGLENFADDFDIFHTADPHYYYSYQLALMRRKGHIKRFIVTSWETIPHNNETVLAKRRIKKAVLDTADLFICYTEKSAAALQMEGVDDGKIKFIPLGVNLHRFKSEVKPVTGLTRYLFVGRLVPEKGIIDMYEAFRRLDPKHASLRIVGEGPLQPILSRRIINDGLQEYVRIEKKSYEDMPQVYNEADVFVLPSRRTRTWEEQYGMVLVEAMASGLPIIAYDTGAIPEVVGKAGLIVKENDIENLVTQMISLSHVKRRLELGTIGRKRATDRYDSRKTADALVSIYQACYGKD